MTTDREVTRIVRSWLEDGVTTFPDRVLDAVLDQVPATHQRRASRPARRLPHMNTPIRAAMAAAAVIAVALIGLNVVPRSGFVAAPASTPSPSPMATASTSPIALSAPLGYQGTGTIAFSRQKPAGSDDLWLIEPSGANERLLVAGACCGLFSPDGTQLAAAVPDGGLTMDGKGLLGVNVYPQPGASVGNTIPADCGACVISTLNSTPRAWSSDGRQVAIDTWSDTDPTLDGMAVEGSPPGWISGTSALGPNEAHRDLPIAFSPDGTTLLFMREERREGPTSFGPLFLLTIARRSAVQLTPPGMTVSTNGLTQGPASWSPDGTTIAFAAVDASSPDAAGIYVTIPREGATLTPIVSGARGATSAHFSPNGDWIAYDALAAGGLHDLHVVHADGSGDQDLTGAFAPGVCCGRWSPDGKALLVTGTLADDDRSDLFIVPLSGEVRQVTQNPGVYTSVQWGPALP